MSIFCERTDCSLESHLLGGGGLVTNIKRWATRKEIFKSICKRKLNLPLRTIQCGFHSTKWQLLLPTRREKRENQERVWTAPEVWFTCCHLTGCRRAGNQSEKSQRSNNQQTNEETWWRFERRIPGRIVVRRILGQIKKTGRYQRQFDDTQAHGEFWRK